VGAQLDLCAVVEGARLGVAGDARGLGRSVRTQSLVVRQRRSSDQLRARKGESNVRWTVAERTQRKSESERRRNNTGYV
jgi:ribosome-binding protein aMBF1 (putative translation factor)